MIAHLRSRIGLLSRIHASSYGRKQNLRLRAPSSNPETSLAAAEKTPSIDSSEHATVIAASGRDSIVVCWHPPKPFPYEHTKPIERTEAEMRHGSSPLRPDIQSEFEAKRSKMAFKLGSPPTVELQDMFHTDRWSFYRGFRKARIDETCDSPPVNRKGL